MKLNSHVLTLGVFAVTRFCCASESSVSVEVSVASKAIDQGLVEADLNWQSSLEFAYGDFYLGGWSMAPLERKGSPQFFDERYEIYFGHGWALGDAIGLDLGATRFLNPNDEDTTEAYLGFFAELGTFSPSVYIYADLDTERWSAEFATTVSLPLELFPVEATARLGAVDGEVDYRYLEVDLIYPVELSDSVKLSVGLHYSDNDFGEGVPDGSLFGSAAVRFGF